MTFYFAWVGGDPIPAFTLATKGDVWGGSVQILGSIWGGELSTTGDLLPGEFWKDKSKTVANLRNISGLIEGHQYTVVGLKAVPIPPAKSGLFSRPLENNSFITPTSPTIVPLPDTTFTYDGSYGGTLSEGVNPAENAGLKFMNNTDTTTVRLYDTSQLTVGDIYGIAAPGIVDNTTFEFLGSNFVTISIPATTTGENIVLTITRIEGTNIIKNLTDTTNLVVGDICQIFGKGIPSSALATYQTDGTFLLSQPATISTKQTFLRIHREITYPDGGYFNEAIHARHDEIPVSIEIDHSEGNAALLTVELQNPHIGLLAPGRNIWCWFSWRDPETNIVHPVFHGRLIALPTDLRGNKVKFQFIAKPSDFENQQTLITASLHNDISYDPVWYTNGIADATSILEARTEDWHTDCKTLVVSLSDVTTGEDGTLEVATNEHVYADMKMKFGAAPLAAVYVTGTITRSQESFGEIDITDAIKTAFGGTVQSYCGDGLLSKWPKPLTNIGGGWTIGLDS